MVTLEDDRVNRSIFAWVKIPMFISFLFFSKLTIFLITVNIAELFDVCAKQQRPGAKVGVLVCGPESLQTSVAETCQAFSTVDYKPSRVAFNYHSVSFDL